MTRPVLLTLKAVPLTANVLSVLFGNRVSVSRTSLLPFTSSVAAGAVVLMPMVLLFWNITELMMSLVVSHIGILPTVPTPVTGGLGVMVPEFVVTGLSLLAVS